MQCPLSMLGRGECQSWRIPDILPGELRQGRQLLQQAGLRGRARQGKADDAEKQGSGHMTITALLFRSVTL